MLLNLKKICQYALGIYVQKKARWFNFGSNSCIFMSKYHEKCITLFCFFAWKIAVKYNFKQINNNVAQIKHLRKTRQLTRFKSGQLVKKTGRRTLRLASGLFFRGSNLLGGA